MLNPQEILAAAILEARGLGASSRDFATICRVSRSTLDNGVKGLVDTRVGTLNQVEGGIILLKRYGGRLLLRYRPRISELLNPDTYKSAC